MVQVHFGSRLLANLIRECEKQLDDILDTQENPGFIAYIHDDDDCAGCALMYLEDLNGLVVTIVDVHGDMVYIFEDKTPDMVTDWLLTLGKAE
jgi:hypothetical protein